MASKIPIAVKRIGKSKSAMTRLTQPIGEPHNLTNQPNPIVGHTNKQSNPIAEQPIVEQPNKIVEPHNLIAQPNTIAIAEPSIPIAKPPIVEQLNIIAEPIDKSRQAIGEQLSIAETPNAIVETPNAIVETRNAIASACKPFVGVLPIRKIYQIERFQELLKDKTFFDEQIDSCQGWYAKTYKKMLVMVSNHIFTDGF